MGPRESLGSGNRRESMMMGPNMGRRESRRMSQMPGMGGGMDRRASRRMSQMPMGRRDSSMAHRQSVFGMQGNYEFDPTNRMNKRESSVFYQGEFDEEMRRRQVDQRRKAVANDSKEARFEKEQRVAQRDEELSYNERVKRVIAKWKMREVQQMFLSWKRYARTQAKARKAEAEIGPYLEVLYKESWERDEKDVDLLYSFVKEIKFFQEIEENMGRDLCRMFQLEAYDEDEIAVMQGEEGDTFYIILYGSVSIWLEPKEDTSEEESEEGSEEGEGSQGGEGVEGGEGGKPGGEGGGAAAGSDAKVGEESKDDPDGKEGGDGVEEKEEEGAERILLGTRGPGDSFGELALIKNQPRAATVQTDEPTYFVVIGKEDYDRTIKVRHQKKVVDKVNFLCRLPFFKDCSISELAELVLYLAETEHPRNKIILSQGDDAGNVHIVLRGEVQVIKSVPIGSRGPNRTYAHALLGIYGPGSIFGHHSILQKIPQPYSMITKDECLTYVLSFHDFFLRLNSATLQILKDGCHNHLNEEQTHKCINQHVNSSQYKQNLVKAAMPTKQLKVNSHRSMFRTSDGALETPLSRAQKAKKKDMLQRKKAQAIKASKALNGKGKGKGMGMAGANGRGGVGRGGGEEEDDGVKVLAVKYGIGAAADALKDKTHDLAKFIEERSALNAAQTKGATKEESTQKRPIKITDLRVQGLINHNEFFMDYTKDCALLVGQIVASEENVLIPNDLMDTVFSECDKAARKFHLIAIRWSVDSFRILTEPIHSSSAQMSAIEMMQRIADAALEIDQVVEAYSEEHYDEHDMTFECAAGMGYGAAFLRKEVDTKKIREVEGPVFDLSSGLCAESCEFGGIRCNFDIYEQLSISHSFSISGSQYVLDGKLDTTDRSLNSVFEALHSNENSKEDMVQFNEMSTNDIKMPKTMLWDKLKHSYTATRKFTSLAS